MLILPWLLVKLAVLLFAMQLVSAALVAAVIVPPYLGARFAFGWYTRGHPD